jgi:hypothetical protein
MSDTFNLNDFVWVRLTDVGRAVIKEDDKRWAQRIPSYGGSLPRVQKEEAENDGWSRWQLWSLMQQFGSEVHLGCVPPFETTIRLKQPAA